MEKKIKPIYEDTRCEGGEAVNALTKLINFNNIKVTTGWMCSGAVLSASPIAQENQVIIFSSGAGSPEVSFAGEYTFRNFPSGDLAGKKLAEFAIENNHKNIAIISENTDYAIGFSNAFKKYFEDNGGNIVIFDKFDSTQRDFKTNVIKIKDQDVDAVFLSVQTYISLSNILKSMKELDFKKDFYFTEQVTGEIIENFKELIEYGIFIEADFERTDEFLELKRNIETINNYEFRELPEYYIASSYDAMYILKEVIEKCNSSIEDTLCIKNNLHAIENREGLTGVMSIDKRGDPDIDFNIIRISNGLTIRVN